MFFSNDILQRKKGGFGVVCIYLSGTGQC